MELVCTFILLCLCGNVLIDKLCTIEILTIHKVCNVTQLLSFSVSNFPLHVLYFNLSA